MSAKKTMNNNDNNLLSNINIKKGIKLPEGWIYIIIGFTITTLFLICNYKTAKDSLKLQ